MTLKAPGASDIRWRGRCSDGAMGVAANDAVVMGLLDALREARGPRDGWPGIVSFDNSQAARRHNITSLHLPWDELGREAVDLLWSSAHNHWPSVPQHRAVSMRLIPRLSFRQRWPSFGAPQGAPPNDVQFRALTLERLIEPISRGHGSHT